MFKNFIKKTFCNVNNLDPILTKYTGVNKNIFCMYLNNPKKKNALSFSLLDNLKKNIDFVNKDSNIRAVILMSKEAGYFCAGADLKEREKMNEQEVENLVHDLRWTFQKFSDIKVPSICGIDGFALGGGLELALSSDIRIGTKNATVGLSEVSLGIIPGAGGTQRLPRLIGANIAKELVFTAERLNGENAYKLGIFNHLVEKYDDLEMKAVEIGEKIAKNAPLAVINAKKAINNGIDHDIKVGLNVEGMCYANILRTEDRIEGMKAFLEKRKPEYKGK
jgi:methylglutaconyl-CoA hydratase